MGAARVMSGQVINMMREVRPVVEGMLGSRKPTKVAAVGLSSRQHSSRGERARKRACGRAGQRVLPKCGVRPY